MFGSNFDTNFGLPAFPFQGQDPQGGMLGTNVPTGDPTAPGSDSLLPGGPTAPQPAAGAAPAVGLPAAPPQPALGAPSPLGGGVLSPGAGAPQPSLGNPTDQTAPAAGVGSPFGKVGV